MQSSLTAYLNKVFVCDARELLPQLPDSSVDAVISDPMYGVAKMKKRNNTFDWGGEPFQGCSESWWRFHQPIYQECRRVLKPGGSLAWAMGCKFHESFSTWFKSFRSWSFTRFFRIGRNRFNHIWLVQTKEQEPIRFPDADSMMIVQPRPDWRRQHPCPKNPEEVSFVVKHLTKPGNVVLDCFCGLGTTLQAAKELERNYIGCDISEYYCRLAKWALNSVNGHSITS